MYFFPFLSPGHSHDCGVFAMKSMESWHAPKDLTKVFSEDDIGHIRIQYANLLFFHVNNQVDRSSVTNFYVKVNYFSLDLFMFYMLTIAHAPLCKFCVVIMYILFV